MDAVDLGFAVLMLPKGDAGWLLGDLLPRDRHAELVASLAADPELATN